MGKELKVKRLQEALAHKCPDRIPNGEFFWTGFVKKCKAKWGEDFDPWRFFDTDYIVITPNLDPKIQSFEILHQEGEDIILKTGFGATIKRSREIPMPHYDAFDYDTFEKMEAFIFDSPSDPRRFFSGGDDQINCVGDALARNIPAWTNRVDSYVEDFPVFGSVCEVYEYLWRMIGTENSLYWMLEDPERYKGVVDKVGDFIVELCKAQIEAGKGRLTGMYIWGDVAYRNGMLFNPQTWREVFKPHVKRIIDVCHENGLLVIYHGCGNATPIYEDMIEIGLDAYNPLECKADLDIVKINETLESRLGFCGNIDMRVLERGNKTEIQKEVLYKMQAAVKGGWIFQSDHSVSSDVEPESYQIALETVRTYGTYPLDLEAIKEKLANL
ncbi:MAG: methylcobalamin:coenzyme methyltransferase [Clostridia bacterium]|jgi:hypothetical protein|nr:methylcobalamin:coenzyme methyltransferase [Clostridia bacterium]